MENTRSKFVKVVWNGVVIRQDISDLKQTREKDTKAGLVAGKKLGAFRTKMMAKTNEIYHKLANIKLEEDDYLTALEKLRNLEAETRASLKI